MKTRTEEKTQRLNRIFEALSKKGISGIEELNPTHLRGELEATGSAPAGEEAHVLPIDDIPAGFTDDQHFERNRHIPATPTREQFDNGFIRSFNLKLEAEDYTPALTDEELNYVSDKTKYLNYVSALIKKRTEHPYLFTVKLSNFDRFLSDNHSFLTAVYHISTGFWVNFYGRAAIILGTILLHSSILKALVN